MGTTINKQNFKESIFTLMPHILNYRRHLHAHPELSFQEYETTSFIASVLDAYHISYKINENGTGLVARIDSDIKGKVIAFRADIDALPITEETNLEYASVNRGCMHACGHDIHTASLLGLCIFFSLHRELIKGSIVFIFQHAEENYPGGANAILSSGILDSVDEFYGMHIDPTLHTGIVGYSYGPSMASPAEFHIILNGHGGHGAKPHEVNDPIIASAHIITALQTIVSRNIDPNESAVISCTKINSGFCDNIIPDQVTMDGTIRTFSKEIEKTITERMTVLVSQITSAFGIRGSVSFVYSYPPCVNTKTETDYIVSAIKSCGYTPFKCNPTMVGEDFAYYLQAKKGSYFFLGCTSPEQEIIGLHNCKLNPDENAIAIAIEIFIQTYCNTINNS